MKGNQTNCETPIKHSALPHTKMSDVFAALQEEEDLLLFGELRCRCCLILFLSCIDMTTTAVQVIAVVLQHKEYRYCMIPVWHRILCSLDDGQCFIHPHRKK